jgi:hypothetical protein
VPDRPSHKTKEEVLATLRHVGAPEEALRAVDAEFGDLIELNELSNLLLRYGITLDWAISRMGGSP